MKFPFIPTGWREQTYLYVPGEKLTVKVTVVGAGPNWAEHPTLGGQVHIELPATSTKKL